MEPRGVLHIAPLRRTEMRFKATLGKTNSRVQGMKELQLKMLKESLNEKWLPSLERLKSANTNDINEIYNYLTSWKTCACCREWYFNVCYDKFCRGCPIFEHSGEKKCRKTPYEKLIDAYDCFIDTGVFSDFVDVVQEECDFLGKLCKRPQPKGLSGPYKTED